MSVFRSNENVVTFKCPKCGKTKKISESDCNGNAHMVCNQCGELMYRFD